MNAEYQIGGEGNCPPEYTVCFQPEAWDEFLEESDLGIDDVSDMAALGDAEAVANFTWEILFLSPWELAYIALPMSVLAFYGLSIYAMFKWLQRKFR